MRRLSLPAPLPLARSLALFLLAALLVPARAPAEEPPTDAAGRERRIQEAREKEAKDLAEFEARVNAAIDRGAKWLQQKQLKDGSYPGFGPAKPSNTHDVMEVGITALAVLTLAHCGVPADHDSIEKAIRNCQFHYSGKQGSMNLKGNGKVLVYIASTLILALDAVYRKETGGAEPVVRRDRYGTPVPPSRPPKCDLPGGIRTWIEELVAVLVKSQVVPDGGWRYPGNPVGSVEGKTDLSNTQYALLGLDAAARCGFPVPVETWTRAAEHLLREQEEEGVPAPVWLENSAWSPGDDPANRFVEVAKAQARGWTYLPGHATLPTGAMTCAGVTCLALVKERLWAVKKLEPALSKRIDSAVLQGLTWLSEHFTVEDNPDPPNQWHYYYLYGLERTGAKCGVRWIGRHDWYREGAEHLLAAQTPAGGWAEAAKSGKVADTSESEITQTCFALLFLRRATVKPVIPVTPPALTGGDAPPADNR
jgi:hypothetical protein